jgi:hypothetical protein
LEKDEEEQKDFDPSFDESVIFFLAEYEEESEPRSDMGNIEKIKTEI